MQEVSHVLENHLEKYNKTESYDDILSREKSAYQVKFLKNSFNINLRYIRNYVILLKLVISP